MQDRLIKSEIFWVSIISFFFLIMGFLPFFWHIIHTPPGHVYLGAHNYPADYYALLGEIKVGQKGDWFYTQRSDPFDNRIYIERPVLVWLGRLWSLAKQGPIKAYHLSRVLLGGIFLLAGWVFIKKTTGFRLLAFFFWLMSVSTPFFNKSQAAIKSHLNDLTYLFPFMRITFIPHHLVRNILLASDWILMLKLGLNDTGLSQKGQKFWLYFCLAFNTAFLGLISPAHLGQALWGLVFLTIFKIVSRKGDKKEIASIALIALMGLFALGAVIYSMGGANNITVNWEVGKGGYSWPTREYLLGVGPILLPAIAGAIDIVKNKEKHFDPLFLIWITAGFLLTLIIPLEKITPIHRVRFMQTPYRLSLAALGSRAVEKLAGKLKNKQLKYIIGAVVILWLILAIGPMINDIKSQIDYPRKYGLNFYVPQETVRAIAWLDKNSREQDIVLTLANNGLLIQALAGNRVWVGHFLTNRYQERQKAATRFLGGQMSSQEADKFLEENEISWVFVGEQEKALVRESLNYNALVKVFGAGQTIIYKYQN